MTHKYSEGKTTREENTATILEEWAFLCEKGNDFAY